MFCGNCGEKLPDGTMQCPRCGFRTAGVVSNQSYGVQYNGERDSFDKGGFQPGMSMNNSYYGNSGFNPPPRAQERLQTDRSLAMYILLTIITCGIYSYYFIYKMAHDVNIACEGDGNSTSGLVAFILLSFITCGIYSLLWEYGLANRLAANAPRYGLSFQENGTSVLLWYLFGALLCGIGPFIAMNILIKNSNQICWAYNKMHGFD